MQFLKTLFWALLIGLGAAFAYANWFPVDLRLWGGLIAEVNLPLLLFVMFLIGLVPMLLIFHTVRWRLRQRLASTERALADLRAANAAASEPAASESLSLSTSPSQSTPPSSPVQTAFPDDQGPLFQQPIAKDEA